MNQNEAKRLTWPRLIPNSVIDGWYMAGREYQQAMRTYLDTHTMVFDSKQTVDGWQITARMVEKGSGDGTAK